MRKILWGRWKTLKNPKRDGDARQQRQACCSECGHVAITATIYKGNAINVLYHAKPIPKLYEMSTARSVAAAMRKATRIANAAVPKLGPVTAKDRKRLMDVLNDRRKNIYNERGGE